MHKILFLKQTRGSILLLSQTCRIQMIQKLMDLYQRLIWTEHVLQKKLHLGLRLAEIFSKLPSTPLSGEVMRHLKGYGTTQL